MKQRNKETKKQSPQRNKETKKQMKAKLKRFETKKQRNI